MPTFLGILTIMLVGLKALGYITFSWLLVLLPAIIYSLFVVLMTVLVVLCILAAAKEAQNSNK